MPKPKSGTELQYENLSEQVEDLNQDLADVHERLDNIVDDYDERLGALETLADSGDSSFATTEYVDDQTSSLWDRIYELQNRLEEIETQEPGKVYNITIG